MEGLRENFMILVLYPKVYLERFSSGTTGDHVHHWSFNLEEPVVGEVRSQILDDLGAGDKFMSNVGIHNQIQMSLTITSFFVFQT